MPLLSSVLGEKKAQCNINKPSIIIGLVVIFYLHMFGLLWSFLFYALFTYLTPRMDAHVNSISLYRFKANG